MWYDEAEGYVQLITVFVVVLISLLSIAYKEKTYLHPSILIIAAFGLGLCIGIEKTAKGTFKLPLGVMQKQLHEEWGLPLRNLQRPVDRE